MLLLSITSLCLAALPVAQAMVESYTFPLPVSNGSVTKITTEIGSRPLDTVWIPNPNSTTYEWWYFDAVASDLSASIVLQPIVEGGDFALVLDLSLPNGSTSRFTLPYDKGYFSTAGSGSNMIASNGEWGYTSSEDLSHVDFQLNIPAAGVSGTVKFRSVAPPHVTCGCIEEGASLVFYWNLLWINLIPDAVASVNLSINETAVAFEGFGYHDQNWGASPFLTDINQWYWGHGRTAEYSVVWFHRLSGAGNIDTSAYISKDGEIVYASCGDNIIVRVITNQGVVYPINYSFNGTIEGVQMNIDAGDIGKFAFTLSNTQNILETAGYHRYVGNFAGGLIGKANTTGVGLWEQEGPFPTPL